MAKNCKTCGSTLEFATLPLFTGTDREVRISFKEMPALVCSQSHEKRMLDGDFSPFVLEEVLGKAPMSNSKGFAKKQHLCSKCNTPLEPTKTERQKFQFRLTWKDTSPFEVELDGPSVSCSNCMTVQMLKTSGLVQTEIPNAIVNAFDNIRIKR